MTDQPFTHLDASGRARMVDVTAKQPTVRAATAAASVVVSAEVLALLRSGEVPKGDVLAVARIAGILAEHRLNIATLRLSRKQRGGDAFMVIEVDDAPPSAVRDEVRALPWVRWAYRLDKVSA